MDAEGGGRNGRLGRLVVGARARSTLKNSGLARRRVMRVSQLNPHFSRARVCACVCVCFPALIVLSASVSYVPVCLDGLEGSKADAGRKVFPPAGSCLLDSRFPGLPLYVCLQCPLKLHARQ